MKRFILFLGLTGPALSAEPANPPSKVENPIPEAALPTLKLTPRAVERLGIATAAVTRKAAPRSHLYPGTVRLPLGDASDALAPAPISGPEELRKLAELQAVADGAVASAKAALDAAAQARQRAETLSAARAGSERVLDEAKAAEAQARAALTTATQTRALLGKPALQVTTAAERWIAIALPATDAGRADLTQPAQIRTPGTADAKPQIAKPVARPTTALPGGCVEVLFELTDATLTTGQQVEVEIPDKTKDAAAATVLCVPWSAIVHDATGGAWVYEQKTADSFTRRRVSLIRVTGTDALLAAGPPEGTKVVTTGVAELFGAEFGGFK